MLFSDSFRDELATRLQREGLIAIGFSPESDLERLVASGVVALSYDTGSGTSDATQRVPEPFTCLQAHLPKSHVARSVLICRCVPPYPPMLEYFVAVPVCRDRPQRLAPMPWGVSMHHTQYTQDSGCLYTLTSCVYPLCPPGSQGLR